MNRRKTLHALLGFVAALSLVAAGCGGGGESSTPSSAGAGGSGATTTSASGGSSSPSTQPAGSAQVSAAAMEEAREIYKLRCTPCHGQNGEGDGAASAALNPKPRNYTDAAWQKTVSNEAIEKAIVGGGPAVGLSTLMPPNPDLKDKPEVVKGLREIIRSFAK